MIDYSENMGEIRQFSDSEQVHVSFWVQFDSLKFSKGSKFQFRKFPKALWES